jgi:hypothetical protein
VQADSNYIDVTVELFFQAHRSEDERWLMDGDFDGRITNDEIYKYLKYRTEQFKRGLQLTVNGHRLRVMTLYPPGLRLYNTDVIANQPLELKLYYFARVPEGLQANSVITLKDSLWKSAPALYSLSVQGKGNCRLAIANRSASILSPQHFEGRRQMQIRWLKTPPSKPPDYPERKKPTAQSDSLRPAKEGPIRKTCNTTRNKYERQNAATNESGESK